MVNLMLKYIFIHGFSIQWSFPSLCIQILPSFPIRSKRVMGGTPNGNRGKEEREEKTFRYRQLIWFHQTKVSGLRIGKKKLLRKIIEGLTERVSMRRL